MFERELPPDEAGDEGDGDGETDGGFRITSSLDTGEEDLDQILRRLDEKDPRSIIESLEQDHRRRLESVLAFADGTAGRLMSTDVLSVRPDVSLSVVLRWLRRHHRLPSHTDALMVVDEQRPHVFVCALDCIIAPLLISLIPHLLLYY